ncbi:STY4528 family pathogenicity island replication protein [Lelliottia amnigena]|uniref:STY4528 family pathogenicity island replication protein n=1 Tax=Lelliottia amnigena TaxID=61646 RepID=UPI004055C726
MPDKPRLNRPLSLNELFDKALTQLAPPPVSIAPTTDSPAARTLVSDGLLFSGSRHDSVPRALLQDKRLTPLERNAWQVLRLLHQADGISTFPTYDQLAPWLSSTPCTERASHETVARALTLLRLTCWISLVQRRRDPASGRLLGNLYVLHDEPLTLYEAIQLDQDYLGLVNTALTHASKSLQRVALHTLKALSEDPQLIDKALPSRIQILMQRLQAQDWVLRESQFAETNNHESEEGKEVTLRNPVMPSSETELRPAALQTGSLRDPKTDSTVSIKRTKKYVRTATHEPTALRVPDRFRQLKATQQAGVWSALQPVDTTLHQAIFDEWEARCRDNTVRNEAGYLFGIIQKAMQGDFQPWAGQKSDIPAPIQQAEVKPPPDTSGPVSREVAQAYVDRIRKLIRRGKGTHR